MYCNFPFCSLQFIPLTIDDLLPIRSTYIHCSHQALVPLQNLNTVAGANVNCYLQYKKYIYFYSLCLIGLMGFVLSHCNSMLFRPRSNRIHRFNSKAKVKLTPTNISIAELVHSNLSSHQYYNSIKLYLFKTKQ